MTTLFQDPVIGQPDASSVLQAPGQSAPGLGLAGPNVAQDAMQTRVNAMPVDQRIFSGLGEVGAALKGDPSPMAVQDQTDQKTRMNNLKILQDTTQALQDGYKTLQGLQGSDRTAFADSWGASLDQTKPGMGNLFKAYAKNPSILDTLEKYATQLPASIQQRIRTDPYGTIDWAYSPAGQTVINTIAQAPMLKDATQRGTFLIHHLSQVVTPETAALIHHDGPLTTADFIKINDDVKNHPEHASLAIPDEVMNQIGDNPKFLSALNLLDSKGQQDVLKKQAEEGLSSTAFQKDSSAYQKMVDAGNGNSPEALRLKANLDRRDAPTSIMLNPNQAFTHGTAGLTKKQNDALYGPDGAVTLGKVDPYKINSRTARLFADAYIANPNIDMNKLGAARPAEIKFTSGPQGDTVRALSVVDNHLGTLEDLYKAQNTNDVLLYNKVRARWLQETGSELPTNTNLAAEVVGKEVIKALGVAGAGGEREREDMAKNFAGTASDAQRTGAIATARSLVNGQTKGLAHQYEAATGKKDFYERFQIKNPVGTSSTGANGSAKFLGFEK